MPCLYLRIKEVEADGEQDKFVKFVKYDLRVTPVKTNNPWVRLHLERLFINKYNLVEDGINNVL